MTKRSVEVFRPTGVDPDRNFYSASDVNIIIEAAGRLPSEFIDIKNDDGIDEQVSRKKHLEYQLQRAVQYWYIESQFQSEPTAAQLNKRFEQIEKACDRVFKSLSIEPNQGVDDIPSSIRRGGLLPLALREAEKLGGFPTYSSEGLLRDAITGVERLRRWAQGAKARQKYLANRSSEKRHSGDVALNQWIGELAGIWIEIFEKELTRSTGTPGSKNAGRTIGPLVHFIEACLRPVMSEATPSRNKIGDRVLPLFFGKSKKKKS